MCHQEQQATPGPSEVYNKKRSELATPKIHSTLKKVAGCSVFSLGSCICCLLIGNNWKESDAQKKCYMDTSPCVGVRSSVTISLQHHLHPHKQHHNKLIQWVQFPLDLWQKITANVTRLQGDRLTFGVYRFAPVLTRTHYSIITVNKWFSVGVWIGLNVEVDWLRKLTPRCEWIFKWNWRT